MAKPQISVALDIVDVKVLKVEVSANGDLHIRLESTLKYGCAGYPTYPFQKWYFS